MDSNRRIKVYEYVCSCGVRQKDSTTHKCPRCDKKMKRKFMYSMPEPEPY